MPYKLIEGEVRLFYRTTRLVTRYAYIELARPMATPGNNLVLNVGAGWRKVN
jgi:hypothetical protein